MQKVALKINNTLVLTNSVVLRQEEFGKLDGKTIL